jgi:CBS domain-containing protein
MLVKDLMSSPCVTVPLTMTGQQVARLMQERDIGSVVVVDDAGRLAGIITESDFTGIGRCVPFSLALAPVLLGARAGTWEELRRIYDEAQRLPASQIMGTKKVYTAAEDEPVGQAVHRLLQRGIKHLPVVRDGRPVGMLTRHDVLRLLDESSAGTEDASGPRPPAGAA